MVEGESKRIAFTVEYDGRDFFGWQLQPRLRTVQSELESAASRLLDRPARVIGSGRTDRGVHATGQVAIVDAPASWSPTEFRRAMNALLPAEIRVSHAAEVARDFHPRFNAIERAYVYRVGTTPTSASPFSGRWCWMLERPIDRTLLDSATPAVIGDHSFRAFAKAGQEHRGDRCIVYRADWSEWGALGLEFRITANRFLHHMVRYLVGTLVEVGVGRRPPEDVGRLLAGDPRLRTSPPAPCRGLFLTRVSYPPGQYPPAGPDDSALSPPTLSD